MAKRKSQLDSILDALKSGETLTPLDALNRFSCFRLGARIFDIRAKGYEVENIGTDEGNYAKYKLKYHAPVPVMPPAFPPKPAENKQSLFTT